MTALEIIKSIPQSVAPPSIPQLPNGWQLPALPAHLINLSELTGNMLSPNNYFSVEELKEELSFSNATSLELTCGFIFYDLVFDPMSKSAPSSENWEVCLSFKERKEILVINAKVRIKAMQYLCGSHAVAFWIDYINQNKPRVALFIGDVGGKAALTLERASGGNVVDVPANDNGHKQTLVDINDDLFN